MCLNKPIPHEPAVPVRLYKVFKEEYGILYPIFTHAVKEAYVPYTLYTATDEKWSNPNYPACFHGLLTKQKAESYKQILENSELIESALNRDEKYVICLVEFSGSIFKEEYWDYEFAATKMYIHEKVPA